jgi:predicted fused transcriptional regulator/phosphomethylpyrimidine kinase
MEFFDFCRLNVTCHTTITAFLEFLFGVREFDRKLKHEKYAGTMEQWEITKVTNQFSGIMELVLYIARAG